MLSWMHAVSASLEIDWARLCNVNQLLSLETDQNTSYYIAGYHWSYSLTEISIGWSADISGTAYMLTDIGQYKNFFFTEHKAEKHVWGR